MTDRIQIAVVLAALLAASPARAGRPLSIDDAGTQEHRHWKVDAGIEYSADAECDHVDMPVGVGYGLLPTLEIGAGFGGQIEERLEESGSDDRAGGIGDLVLAAKWSLYAGPELQPSLALAPSVKLPTADEDDGLGSGEVDADITAILSHPVTARAGVHLNAGYTWVGDTREEPADDELHGGVAADYQVTDAVQVVAEAAAAKAVTSGERAAFYGRGGLRWAAGENLTLDAAAGLRLAGRGEDWTCTIGATQNF